MSDNQIMLSRFKSLIEERARSVCLVFVYSNIIVTITHVKSLLDPIERWTVYTH